MSKIKYLCRLVWNIFGYDGRLLYAALVLTCVLAGGFLHKVRGQDVLADGHPVIAIDPANRMANADANCWWCSAESIGKQYGITALYGLTAKALAAGYVRGADEAAIDVWNAHLGLTVRRNPSGKTQAGVDWLRARLDAGVPVIVGINLRHPDGKTVKHVLIVTYLSYQAVTWPDKSRDFEVRYVDTNATNIDARATWTRFWTAADGTMWAYDLPKRQDAPKSPAAPVEPPTGTDQEDLRSGRLMQSTGKFEPRTKFVDPAVAARVASSGTLPTQIPYLNNSHVGEPGWEIKVKGGHPLVTGKVPSNQDLKDGVQRPSDVLETNAFGRYYFGGYDYYFEFKEKVRTGQVNPR